MAGTIDFVQRDVAWQYFAHSFRRPTTRFYYHAETNQSSGLVCDDTIVESFGEEHRFGKVLFDLKVKQIVPLLHPETFKNESLHGIQFKEKGALLVHDMTEFLLEGCRPERAVENLERALRAQSSQQLYPC
ncbi:protein kinase [Phytophthora infestans T30-4]|uniref:Protein kinase n=1 Tax=Phytophthora infestans (strain T30-4) TaxID=403677 RepID=D0NWL5_PHYIT|nr:protein kinase [Phytophthora infestans T30-4]EEY67078.1 protein kinase [Phytophthora infestans T30-4]|eukprot:XP_002896530.1 protein kinase [Phytophthora infestans T30-4]